MSNLSEYKSVVDEKLHGRVFINDPSLVDTNIYVNRIFSGTLQQLFIVRNWSTLSTVISPDELWTYLKLHEYRNSQVVFDGTTGNVVADAKAQELYKKYYYNSVISPSARQSFDIRRYFNTYTLLCIVVLLVLFFYITTLWQQQVDTLNVDNLLQMLETSTRAQQW